MKKLLQTTILAAGLTCAVPAHANEAEMAQLREQLATMQAEMLRMSNRLAQMESASEQANTAPPAPVAATSPAPAPSVTSSSPVEIAWKGAPVISSESGWSFKPRGRLMVDAGIINAPDSTGRSDGFGSEIRRARLGVEGAMPGGFGYKFELDFAGNATEVADAIISYEDGGLTIKAGQHNNFQSLEELTSSLNSSFIERAAFTDAFGFERRVGLSAQVKSGDVIVQGGLFTDNIGDLPGQAWSADGRLVFAPKLGDAQLHLGASAHYADLEAGDTARYRQRPLAHFTSERFINTGNLSAQSELGIGGEAAIISGPFHAAGEVFWQSVDRPGALTDPTFFGGYAEAGFFLTGGDSRGYKSGTFDRTKPANPVEDGGMGALQVNLRYDYLDLTDGGIVGGSQNGLLASLIWIPTAYTRLMLNYGRLSYDNAVYPAAGGDTSYNVDTLALRAQIDF